MRRLALLATALLVAFAASPADMHLVASAANCPTPIGVANTATDPEPTVPLWCVTGLAAPPTTGAADGFGGFIDPFGETLSAPAHLNDGEAGYHVTDIANGGNGQAQHGIVDGGYFVGDLAKLTSDQGTDLSPAQSFTFQNGKLVLEADVAAGSFGFADSSGGDVAWPEIDWSTSPTPSVATADENLYGYGYFQGNWSAGCRLQARHALTCAVESSQADRPLAGETQDQGPCFPASSSRVMELSGFEACGTTHSGFSEDFGAPTGVFRSCPQNTVDPCLDRFRLEWSAAGLVAYVNGVKFAEDSGWDANHQLPAAIVNGSTPVFAHFVDFSDFSDSSVIRVHWQRLAVNPHDAAGSPLPPSASPTFGQPSPSPTPTPSPSPSPTVAPSPSPTATPSPSPSPTPRPAVLLGDQRIEGTDDSNTPGQAEAFSYTAGASGTVGHLAVYVDGSNAAASVVLGLYADSGGRAGTLLTQGSVKPTKNAWAIAPVPVATVTAGQRYWIAILGPASTGTVGFRDVGSAGTTSQTSSQTSLSTLPASWLPGQNWPSTPASAYATT